MNIYEELNKLPYIITRKTVEKCLCCGKKTSVEIRYELKIDVIQFDEIKRYRIYYKSSSYSFAADKVIGNDTGIGHRTLEQALAELKGYLPRSDA